MDRCRILNSIPLNAVTESNINSMKNSDEVSDEVIEIINHNHHLLDNESNINSINETENNFDEVSDEVDIEG